MCRSARRKSPQAEPRTIAQQQGVKLRASVPRRCEIAIQDRGEASQGGDSADLGDVPFHNAPGRQYYAVKDVDRVHRLSLDRFAYTPDTDTMFQRHT